MITGSDISAAVQRHIRKRSGEADDLLASLCRVASRDGLRIYLAGGLIRDVALDDRGDQSNALDLDIAVDGDISPLLDILTTHASAKPVVHERFGTAAVELPDGTTVDLARTRSERYSSPGALPIVSPAPIEIDLSRRDFSVNAIAIPLCGDNSAVLDPYNGLADLRRRTIRTLHPESFRDDPTRMLRAARYAARIRGRLAAPTLAELRQHRKHLVALTTERFGGAWRLLLQEPDAHRALRLARRWGLPSARDPRWQINAMVNRVATSPDHFWAAVGLTDRSPEVTTWLPKTVGMRRSERLALEGGARLRVMRRRIARQRQPSHIVGELRTVPDVALLVAAQLWDGPSGAAVIAYLERRAGVRAHLSARRLIELGVEPGPLLGQSLRALEDAIWNGNLHPDDDEAIAQFAQKLLVQQRANR